MAGEIIKVNVNKIVHVLSNSEITFEFNITPRVFQVQNMGSSTIYASLLPDIETRINSNPALDVTAILPGASVIIENRYIEDNRTIYLTGAGDVQVTATNIATGLYTGSGGNGGGSGSGSGEENVIEKVKVNGDVLTVAPDKSVNIDVPTKVSDLPNDSGYITAVPDTYATKTYVGEQIVNAGHLSRSIVTALPADAEASENVIYMLKADNASGEDKYKEYMKIEGTLQLVGDTSVDLSDYVKTEDIPAALPANGGNADTVNNHTVNADVPENAVFTDTVYTLPKASERVLGGVILDGTTITVDENGVISVAGTGGGGMIADVLLDIMISMPKNNSSTKDKYSPADGTIFTLPNNISDYKILTASTRVKYECSEFFSEPEQDRFIEKQRIDAFVEFAERGDPELLFTGSTADAYGLFVTSKNTVKLQYREGNRVNYDRLDRCVLIGYK